MHALQEFFFYCPPGVRGERGKLGRRAGPGKRALPEAECLTPASKRARLTYLATTKDVNKAPLPADDLVRSAVYHMSSATQALLPVSCQTGRVWVQHA